MPRSAPILMVVLVAVACAALADWPQFQGPTRNGVAAKGVRARTFGPNGPKIAWTVKVGPGFAAPAIRDGKVYLLDRPDRKQDVLRCFDLAKGTELWTYAYDAPGRLNYDGSRSTPAVDDKYVFTVGSFGDFHCIDLATHKAVWTKHLLKDHETKIPHWGVAQSPLLHKDLVIVAPQSRTVGVAAYEKTTGKLKWTSRPIGRMAYASPFLTTVDGVEQVVMLSANRIAGVSAADGELLWTYGGWRCNIPIATPIALGDGMFLVTGGYDAGSALFKVTRRDGKFTATTVKKIPDHGAQIHNPLIHKGHIYAQCNTKTVRDGLMCFDLSGNVKWRTGQKPWFDWGGMLLAEGLIYMIDGKTGDLVIIDPKPEKYVELARGPVLSGRTIWGPIVLSGDRLVCRDQKQMRCVDLSVK